MLGSFAKARPSFSLSALLVGRESRFTSSSRLEIEKDCSRISYRNFAATTPGHGVDWCWLLFGLSRQSTEPPPPSRCAAAPEARCQSDRTSNIEHSTSNIEGSEFSALSVRCSVFNVERSFQISTGRAAPAAKSRDHPRRAGPGKRSRGDLPRPEKAASQGFLRRRPINCTLRPSRSPPPRTPAPRTLPKSSPQSHPTASR